MTGTVVESRMEPATVRSTELPTGPELDPRGSGLDLGSSHWRPRFLRNHDGAWPYNEASSDESYFTRLRDELRAEGTLNSWFETA